MTKKKIYVLADSVYKSETTFLKNLKQLVSRDNFETSWLAKKTYQIYEVSESGTLLEYKQSLDNDKIKNERDLQLKSLLNQLDTTDTAILNLISKYSELETFSLKEKERHLSHLNSLKFDINGFKKYIINFKDYFFSRSNDVEWIKTILMIHNFRDCNSSSHYYDRNLRKYVRVEVSNELKSAFQEAKKLIKKSKKNVKTK